MTKITPPGAGRCKIERICIGEYEVAASAPPKEVESMKKREGEVRSGN